MLTIAADIEDIARTIWATLFDLPLELAEVGEFSAEPSVTSCVQIDGAWHGALVLKCPMPLARTLTAQMFQAQSPPDLDDVRDALGELANMLGGNVKALLPAPCQISLPAVAVGSDYELSVIGAAEVASVTFLCGGEPLLVTLLQRAGAADAE